VIRVGCLVSLITTIRPGCVDMCSVAVSTVSPRGWWTLFCAFIVFAVLVAAGVYGIVYAAMQYMRAALAGRTGIMRFLGGIGVIAVTCAFYFLVFDFLRAVFEVYTAVGVESLPAGVIGNQWFWLYADIGDQTSIIGVYGAFGCSCTYSFSVFGVSIDVVHSWFVPSFGFKLDVYPGFTSVYLLPVEILPSIVLGGCAEFCGPFHPYMLVVVYFD